MATLIAAYGGPELNTDEKRQVETVLRMALPRVPEFWGKHGNIGVHEYLVGYLAGLEQSPMAPNVFELTKATLLDITLSTLTEIDSEYKLDTRDLIALAMRINTIDGASTRH